MCSTLNLTRMLLALVLLIGFFFVPYTIVGQETDEALTILKKSIEETQNKYINSQSIGHKIEKTIKPIGGGRITKKVVNGRMVRVSPYIMIKINNVYWVDVDKNRVSRNRVLFGRLDEKIFEKKDGVWKKVNHETLEKVKNIFINNKPDIGQFKQYIKSALIAEQKVIDGVEHFKINAEIDQKKVDGYESTILNKVENRYSKYNLEYSKLIFFVQKGGFLEKRKVSKKTEIQYNDEIRNKSDTFSNGLKNNKTTTVNRYFIPNAKSLSKDYQKKYLSIENN